MKNYLKSRIWQNYDYDTFAKETDQIGKHLAKTLKKQVLSPYLALFGVVAVAAVLL